MFSATSHFDAVRQLVGAPRPPRATGAPLAEEHRLMTEEDGLQIILCVDCEGLGDEEPPQITTTMLLERVLWAVRTDEVVAAYEICAFSLAMPSGKIKHTNLTGGGDAYAGGELLHLSGESIIVNGCSGRYGPRNEAEMQALERAFHASGYKVWSMGYDKDAGRPYYFGAVDPVLIR